MAVFILELKLFCLQNFYSMTYEQWLPSWKSSHKSSKSISGIKLQLGIENEYLIETVPQVNGDPIVIEYKRHRLLGKGAFAYCYQVQHLQTKKRYAAKVIDKNLLGSSRTKIRVPLQSQIKLHKRLHHQNVVQFQHYFEDEKNVYIFLELCQRESLNQLLKIRNNFTIPQIQFFLYGIIQGVNYLHFNHIIHRDLKLGNVFLDKHFIPKIGDFGLATKLEFKNQCKRTVCGTPNYIAPQVITGKGYSFQIDIWAIGIVLYTFFYTIPPFETEEAHSTYQKIKNVDFQLCELSIVPPEAISLIRNILTKEPSERLTLNQILNSDFMKLGKGILKELPIICARRMPNSKELNLAYKVGNYLHTEKFNSKTAEDIKHPADQGTTTGARCIDIQFVDWIQRQGDLLFYTTSHGTAAVMHRETIVMIKHHEKYHTFTLKKPQNIEGVSLSEEKLKTILNCNIKKRQWQYSTMQTNQITYIEKITKYNDVELLRLSNKYIQVHFQDEDFLLNKRLEVLSVCKKAPGKNWQFSPVSTEAIMINDKENCPMSPLKLKCLRGIIKQILGKNKGKQ